MNRLDDWYDVRHVTDDARRIVEGSHYGQYLVTGADRALLVDAGIGIGDLRGLVRSLVDVPVTLFLTHWHWDHIGNASQFEDVRIHRDERSPDGRVAIDGRSDEFVDSPARFVRRWRDAGNRFPDAFEPEAYAIDPVEEVTPVTPGETFDLGDRRLESYATPGHSPGHLALLDRDEGVLYGGDIVHLDAGLHVEFSGGDLRAYRDTFDRLVDLRDDGAFDTLLTCHNPPFVGDELAVLDRLRDGVERILDREVEPESVQTDRGEVNRYEFDGSPVFTARPAT